MTADAWLRVAVVAVACLLVLASARERFTPGALTFPLYPQTMLRPTNVAFVSPGPTISYRPGYW